MIGGRRLPSGVSSTRAPPSVRFTDEVRSIRLETVIAARIGSCFDLSLSVDAHTASMSQSGEQAIGGITSGVMNLGDTVTWPARGSLTCPCCFLPAPIVGWVLTAWRVLLTMLAVNLDDFTYG
jgi:hypothetical protein